MPTYQYECSNCSHGFEASQSMTENRLKKCPKCGRLRLQRLIGSGSGIIFKGTGFYETDYKRKVPAQDSSSEKSSQPSSKPSPGPAAGSHGCAPSCGCAA